MAKIPKNLTDKDMFKNYVEEKSIEDIFTEGEKAKNPVKEKKEDIKIAYLTPDIIEKLGKMLLELKLDLYKDGIVDYNIKVERDGNKIVLSPSTRK